MKHMNAMLALVDNAVAEMVKLVHTAPEQPNININASHNIEREINGLRKQLKKQNLQDVNDGVYSYQLGVFYVDFISECEKLGDYVMNVVQATK